jgi:nucleoside-diphosphate-sugar epimerase
MTATNLVHRDDAVAAASSALSCAARPQGVVHVVDDDHCPRREMLAAAARRIGAPPPEWSDPAGDRVAGKHVISTRLGPWLGVTLRHPWHGGDGRAGR